MTSSGGQISAGELPASVVTGSGTPKKGSVAVASNGEANGHPILLEAGEDGAAWVADSSQTVGVTYIKVPMYDVKNAPFHAKGRGSEGAIGEDQVAVQAAITKCGETGGVVFFSLPPGGYYNLSTEGLVYAGNANVDFLGVGSGCELRFGNPGNTSQVIKFGTKAFSCPDSEGNLSRSHTWQNLRFVGPSEHPSAPNHNASAPGYPPSLMFGPEMRNSAVMINCNSSGFYCAVEFRGDHQSIYGGVFSGGYGLYWGPNLASGTSSIYANQNLVDVRPSGTIAAVGGHPDNKISGQMFFLHASNSPYAFYREAPFGGNATTFAELFPAVALDMETIGNADFYEEGQASTAFPPTGTTSGGLFGTLIDFAGSSTVTEGGGSFTWGNVQILKITATGGTFKIIVPASENYAGGTTAAIKAKPTNAELESALTTLMGAGTAVVSTVSEGQQILLIGKGTLLGANKMTLETGSLTGGTAELTEPAVDPKAGPYVRPGKTVKIIAPGSGKFNITVETAGGVKHTTGELNFNCSAEELRKALYQLENVGAYGCIVYPITTGNIFIITFVGTLLGTEPTVTVSAGSVEAGSTDELKPRHREYVIDVGKIELKMEAWATNGIQTSGTKGFIRERVGAGRFFIGGIQAKNVREDSGIKGGTKQIYNTPGNFGCINRMEDQFGEYIVMNVPHANTPIEAGSLLAHGGTRAQAKIYPISALSGALAEPHAGFATGTVPTISEGQWPVIASVDSKGWGGVSMLYDAAGTPAANKHLKPSAETAGKVTQVTAAADYVVGISIAAGSGGKVEAAPKGCA